MNQQPASIVASSGLTLSDSAERDVTDMIAAFSCVLGHRHDAIVAAITEASAGHLGSVHDRAPVDLAEQLGEPFSQFADVCLVPSASEANEWAIRIARALGGGEATKYRIVTALGSDHGQTLACRSASGRIAAQADGGPLVAGFKHVAAGDARAIGKAVDETVAAVLMTPVDGSRGGQPLDANYLSEVRRICDEAGALLIIDETGVPPAVRGQWFFHQADEVQPDILTAAAGWTGGLPGGLVLLSESVIERWNRLGDTADDSIHVSAADEPAGQHDPRFSLRRAGRLPDRDYPVLRAMVQATAAAVRGLGGPGHVEAIAGQWADGLQSLAGGFEFIPAVNTAGLWTVIPMDLSAAEVAAAADRLGLRLIASGETTLLACPPINLTAPEMAQMLDTLRAALETMERQPIES